MIVRGEGDFKVIGYFVLALTLLLPILSVVPGMLFRSSPLEYDAGVFRLDGHAVPLNCVVVTDTVPASSMPVKPVRVHCDSRDLPIAFAQSASCDTTGCTVLAKVTRPFQSNLQANVPLPRVDGVMDGLVDCYERKYHKGNVILCTGKNDKKVMHLPCLSTDQKPECKSVVWHRVLNKMYDIYVRTDDDKPTFYLPLDLIWEQTEVYVSEMNLDFNTSELIRSLNTSELIRNFNMSGANISATDILNMMPEWNISATDILNVMPEWNISLSNYFE